MNKVLKTIEKYNLIEKNDKIVVGVSGGPDSICLLHILNSLKEKYNLELFVAHINHMIRENAVKDEEYVIDFCSKINVPVYVNRADVLKIAKEQKIGTEEAGRKVRYDFFDEIMKKTSSNKIAIAHNSNDNVETVIMNIIRGTGISGLKGIEPKRDDKYIRPLIECSRQEIEDYCKKNNLNPRHDESNDENIYTRNKIRNIVIPYIKENFNPNIINTINRLSNVAQEENDYINNVVEKTYKDICIEEQESSISLDLKKFNAQDEIIKKYIIIYTINRLNSTANGIEQVNINDIIKLCKNNIGNKFLIPKKGTKILVKCRKIFFVKY